MYKVHTSYTQGYMDWICTVFTNAVPVYFYNYNVIIRLQTVKKEVTNFEINC